MARGAGESGQVESYMCSRIRNHPLVSLSSAGHMAVAAPARQRACALFAGGRSATSLLLWLRCWGPGAPPYPAPAPAPAAPRQVKPWAAEYLGQFVAEGSARGFTTGSQWLVWKFESDSTLADAMNGALGPFPVRGRQAGWVGMEAGLGLG